MKKIHTELVDEENSILIINIKKSLNGYNQFLDSKQIAVASIYLMVLFDNHK